MKKVENAAHTQKKLGESPKKNSRHKQHAQKRSFPPLARRRFPLREFHLARFSRKRSRFFFLLLKAAAAHNTQSAARIGEHDREREREFFAGKSE